MKFFEKKEKPIRGYKIEIIMREISKTEASIVEWEAKPDSRDKDIVLQHLRSQLIMFNEQLKSIKNQPEEGN